MFETRAPSAKFTKIGDAVAGEIVDARKTQHTEYKTNIPLYWERNGATSTIVKHAVNPLTGLPNDPKWQYEITLDTGTPDENGNTERRIFVRGQRMEKALKAAIAGGGAGRDGLLIGGWLSCAWTGTEPSQGGGNPANLYTFQYRPPAAGEGRKPDPTPVLAGGGSWSEPVTVAAPARPLPAFNVRRDEPIAKPYRDVQEVQAALTGQPAPAMFDDEPPF